MVKNDARTLLISLFFIGFFLLSISGVMGATETTNSDESKSTSYTQIQNIKKLIGDNTPNFVAKPIIASVNYLEEFRKGSFNNPFIFYSVFIFLFVLVFRFFWRLIF
mgnify:FL=1